MRSVGGPSTACEARAVPRKPIERPVIEEQKHARHGHQHRFRHQSEDKKECHCQVAPHVANALLVWLVLARLKVPGAWLAGAIFALHPVQVESVAWITERKNVLMGFFFLLTLLAWIAFVDGKTKRRWVFYGLALTLYLFALSAKTTACTLPAALFLILWLQHKPTEWKRIIQIIPFLVLGIAMPPLIFSHANEQRVRNGDVVLFFNFRADRARQLSQAFLLKNFDGFDREVWPQVEFVTMTQYDVTYSSPFIFDPEKLADILGEIVSAAGKRQLRIAETEKYAHGRFHSGQVGAFA